jgi:hypothetical protein
MRFAIVAFAGLLACTFSDEASTESCAHMRDHVVDLRVDAYTSAKDGAGRPINLTPHRKALKHALGEKFVSECVATMSSTQIRCALESGTSAAAQNCLLH